MPLVALLLIGLFQTLTPPEAAATAEMARAQATAVSRFATASAPTRTPLPTRTEIPTSTATQAPATVTPVPFAQQRGYGLNLPPALQCLAGAVFLIAAILLCYALLLPIVRGRR